MQGEKVFSELGLKAYVRTYDDETVVAVSDLDDRSKSFYVSTFPEGVSEGIVFPLNECPSFIRIALGVSSVPEPPRVVDFYRRGREAEDFDRAMELIQGRN